LMVALAYSGWGISEYLDQVVSDSGPIRGSQGRAERSRMLAIGPLPVETMREG